MKISTLQQKTMPSGLELTVTGSSTKQQTTNITIRKNFAKWEDANDWYEKREKQIADCLAELEYLCSV